MIRAFNRLASEKHKLRIDEFPPEPFVGDRDAPVVVLGNNPGYTAEGALRKQEPRFIERMRANLLHAPSDCPFVFLAPDIDSGHHKWWRRKLKGLITRYDIAVLARSINRVFPIFLVAIQRLANPTSLWGGAVHFHLVRGAMKRNAVIVLTRGRNRWFRAVPELQSYHGFCELRNKQRGGISEKDCDRFAGVVDAIEASLK